MAALHADEPSRAPKPPPGIERAGNERFIAGTAAVQPGRAGRFGIVSPRDGSVIALDPDMPPDRQRLVFEGARGRWELDGRLLGHGETLPWLPRPGRHVLRLLGPGGVVDTVSFEVRPLPPPQDAGAKMRSTAASITMPHRL
jgi:penicillin-binding protein 1C